MVGDSRKSGRSRKSVDYSKFAKGNSDEDDDDFRDCTPPLKKAKVTEQPKDTIVKVKKARNRNDMLETQRRAPKDRPSLDERKFEKDLQAALRLSQQSSQPLEDDVSKCETKRSEKTSRTTKIKAKPRLDSDSDFDSDGEKESPPPNPVLKTKPNLEKDDDFNPDVANTPDDESDSGESEDDDSAASDSAASDADSDYEENQTEKSTTAITTKPGPKCSKAATEPEPVKEAPDKAAPVPRTPSAPIPRTPSAPTRPTPSSQVSPTVTIKTPLSASSASNRMTAWTPPARIATPSDKPIVTKSPGSGLRLGLSRSQRVKSLHSNVSA